MAIKAGKWKISDKEFDRQYAEATKRGKAAMSKGAHAIIARYDKATRRVVIDLASGVTLLIPVRLIQGLRKASAKELAEIDILGAGSGLYWPKLEVDIGVAGLLEGVFGTKAWMAELGRIGGKASSEAKRAAARVNGKLGGRPRATNSKAVSSNRRRSA